LEIIAAERKSLERDAKVLPNFKMPERYTFKATVNADKLTLSEQGGFYGTQALGGLPTQSYKRIQGVAAVDPPKDSPTKDPPIGSKDPPPQDNPQLAAAVVGYWEGTSNGLPLGYKIELTADGRFIQHSERRKTRAYKVVGSNIEMDFTDAERKAVTDLPTVFKDIKPPAKWSFKATANETQLTMALGLGPIVGGYAPGGPEKQVFKKIGAVGPVGKDPPTKDPPQLAAAVVGTWEGTSITRQGKKVEFTAGGKFIQHSEQGLTRNYSVVGSNIEMDVLDAERDKLTELKKVIPGIKIPAKFSYKASASGTELTLNMEDILVAPIAPGGPLKQTYKRIQGGVTTDPPKDGPKKVEIVGKWEATNKLGQKRTIEFTADKFVEYGQNNQSQSRSYQLAGDKLEIELPDVEQTQLQRVLDTLKRAKGVPRYTAPRHYHFQVAVEGEELMMEPVNNSAAVAAVGAVPGGTVAIRYKKIK